MDASSSSLHQEMAMPNKVGLNLLAGIEAPPTEGEVNHAISGHEVQRGKTMSLSKQLMSVERSIQSLENTLLTMNGTEKGQATGIHQELKLLTAARKELNGRVAKANVESKGGVLGAIKNFAALLFTTENFFKYKLGNKEVQANVDHIFGKQVVKGGKTVREPGLMSKVFGESGIVVKAGIYKDKDVDKGAYQLERAGKEISYGDLMKLTQGQVERFEELLKNAPDEGSKTEIEGKLKDAKDLLSSLEQNQKNIKQHASFKQKTWSAIKYVATSDVKFTMKDGDKGFNKLSEDIKKTFPTNNVVVTQEKIDGNSEDVHVKVKIDGKSVSLSELKALAKQHAADTGGTEGKGAVGLVKTLGNTDRFEAHVSAKQAFFDHGVFKCIHHAGKYVLGSESRISVVEKGEDNTCDKIMNLTKEVFAGSLEVGEHNMPESAANLARFAVSDKLKSNFEVKELHTGRQLSKAELLDKTKQKVDSLRAQLSKVDTKDKAKFEEVSQKLIKAELLQKNLIGKDGNVTEYMSGKRQTLLNIAKVFGGFTDGVYFAANAIQKGYRATITNPRVMSEMREGSTVDKKAAKEIINDVFALRSVFKKGESFTEKCDAIYAKCDTPAKKALLEKTLKRDNILLKKAMDHDDIKTANYLLDKGLLSPIRKGRFHQFAHAEGGLSHFLGSFNSGIMKKTSNLITANVAQRQEIMSKMYHLSPTVQRERIVNEMIYGGNVNGAKALIMETFKNENWDPGNPPAGGPNKEVQAALLFSAMIGSDDLLQAAFGVKEGDGFETIQARVKPYINIANEKGETLLKYADAGTNAHFVTAIEYEAIAYNDKVKEDKGGRLEHLASMVDLLSKDQIKEEVGKLVEDYPELAHLEKSLEKGRSHLRNELNRHSDNLDVNPHHVKSKGGDKPIRAMSAGLAADMDAILEKQLTAANNGVPVKVDCYMSAVKHYHVLKCPNYKYVTATTLTGKMIGCTIAAAGVAAVSAVTSGAAAFVLGELVFQNSVMIGIGVGLGGGWYTKRSVVGKYLATRQGFVNNLHQAEALRRPGAGKAPVVDTKGNPIQKGTVAEPVIETYADGSLIAKSIGKAMKNQDTDAVLNALCMMKPKPVSADDMEELLDGFQYLTRFPEMTLKSGETIDTRTAIIDQLVRCAGTTNQHLEAIYDIQMAAGAPGRAGIEKYLRGDADKGIKGPIEEWKQPGAPLPPREQYEAALLAAAKLGDTVLYRDLINIKGGKAAFLASDGWIKAGGKKTSMLHATMLNRIVNSNLEGAKFATQIYDEMVASNKFSIQVDPLWMGKNPPNPIELLRGGKNITDVMSAGQAAAADEAFGLTSAQYGSFASTVALNKLSEHRAIQHELTKVIPAKVMLNLGAGAIAESVCNAAGAAAHGGGPVAVILARGAATMVMECLVFAGGFGAAYAAGEGLGGAEMRAHKMLHGTSGDVGQLGGTQKEREARVAQRQALANAPADGKPTIDEKMQQAINDTEAKVANTLMEGVKLAQTLTKGVDDVTHHELQSLEAKLTGVLGLSPISRAAIQNVLCTADLPAGVRDIIQRPLMQMLEELCTTPPSKE